jgi:hypothetical protein
MLRFSTLTLVFGLSFRSILHSCIAQLLKEESDPRPEDIECLCKLLTTVGALLDRTTKPELKAGMEVRETSQAEADWSTAWVHD